MRQHKLIYFFALTLLVLAGSNHARSETQTSLLFEQANTFAAQYFQTIYPGAQISTTIKPVASSIKLDSCNKSVQFSTSAKRGGNLSIKAQCSSPRWSIYLRANVKALAPVVIATTTIPKRRLISSAMVDLQTRDLAKTRDETFRQLSAVTHLTTKKTLRPGEVILSRHIEAPTVVQKNDSVIIEARRNGLSIRAYGTALQSGKVGEQISVINTRSDKKIRAVVIAKGHVRTL